MCLLLAFSPLVEIRPLTESEAHCFDYGISQYARCSACVTEELQG